MDSTAKDYRFVTWNVLANDYSSFNTVDRKREPKEHCAARLEEEVSKILDFKADIVGLQEVTLSLLDLLVDKGVSDDYHVVSGMRPGKPDGCVTLLSKARFDLVSSTTHEPSSQGTSVRIGILAVAKDRGTEKEVCVVNTHLEGRPDLGDVRVAQAMELVRLARKEQSAVLLCGDFNEDAMGAMDAALQGERMRRMPTPAGTATCVGWRDGAPLRKTLDYLFYSEDAFSVADEASVRPVDHMALGDTPFRDQSWPSDHFAVIASVAPK